ncbi:MAG: sugar kinase [Betaproteobacteria bacterium RIFCSPLOWO2_02_FULL_66_14]|nr:MAG: sugar kinase [Betaproteobacteria bacterium RIFCSPLOWO2_02_FULL_66_14]
MRTLITGSIAYDTIMVFPDRFRNHLLADQLHILNVCFLAPEMRREFGGTAGNIAFNLKLLGGDPLLMATVGEDIQPYLDRLAGLGIGQEHLKRISGQFTAQAFITTDLDDNQIIAFHPGAMNFSHHNHVTPSLGVRLAIIGPDGKEGMLQHARECAAQSVPFLFDPGQGVPMFSREELLEMVQLADYLAVNDYEGKLVEEKTGRQLDDLARDLNGLVVTLGAKGSLIFAGGERHEIPCVPAQAVLDPTGCGDAYRAGLLYGLALRWDWPTAGRLAALLGAIKIAQRGAQNHRFTPEEIAARFRSAFGYSPWSS